MTAILQVEFPGRRLVSALCKVPLVVPSLVAAFMVLTIIGISYMTHTIDTAIFPHIRIMPLYWAAIVLAPVIAGSLIAHFTAQRTVMRELARLP